MLPLRQPPSNLWPDRQALQEVPGCRVRLARRGPLGLKASRDRKALQARQGLPEPMALRGLLVPKDFPGPRDPRGLQDLQVQPARRRMDSPGLPGLLGRKALRVLPVLRGPRGRKVLPDTRAHKDLRECPARAERVGWLGRLARRGRLDLQARPDLPALRGRRVPPVPRDPRGRLVSQDPLGRQGRPVRPGWRDHPDLPVRWGRKAGPAMRGLS
jgi:hypothetical protein